MPIKTLILDIETFPIKAYCWGLWQQNIGLHMIIDPGGTASWAAAWAGSDEVEYSSIHLTTQRRMLREIWKLLDEADEVVGWNSNSFDLKFLNGEFALMGWGPPSPYKKIDLMRTVKNNMRFISNKLTFIGEQFGAGMKTEHQGFPLWVACMDGNEEAWALFEQYNIQDVALTEDMYNRLRPWISTGANRSAVLGEHVCPNCGSDKLHSRGTESTKALTYRRWRCVDCGSWSRSKVATKVDRKKQLVGIR
jgi:hypothetical protein